MRTLPLFAIALLATAPAFAAAPAPAATKHIVLSTDAADPRTLRDLLLREGYTVTVAPAAAVADTGRSEAIDYPSQLGPEGPRATR